MKVIQINYNSPKCPLWPRRETRHGATSQRNQSHNHARTYNTNTSGIVLYLERTRSIFKKNPVSLARSAF